MKLAEVVATEHKLGIEVSNLKIWLKQKETVKYYEYLKNGGNARTAKEKVIDELKMSKDEDVVEWLQKEVEYNNLKLKLILYTNLRIVAQALLSSGENLKVAEEFIKETLNKI